MLAVQRTCVDLVRKLSFGTDLVTDIIKVASEYKSEIWVEKDGKRANAKSLLGLLSLGLVTGGSLTVVAEGSDEKDAVNCLKKLIVTP